MRDETQFFCLGSEFRPIMSWPEPMVADFEGAVLRAPVSQSILRAARRRRPMAVLAALVRHRGRRAPAAAEIAAAFPDLPVDLAVEATIVDGLRIHHRMGGCIALLCRGETEAARHVVRNLGLKARIFDTGAAVDRGGRAAVRVLADHYGPRGFVLVGSAAGPDALAFAAARAMLVGAAPDLQDRLRTAGVPASRIAPGPALHLTLPAAVLRPACHDPRTATAGPLSRPACRKPTQPVLRPV